MLPNFGYNMLAFIAGMTIGGAFLGSLMAIVGYVIGWHQVVAIQLPKTHSIEDRDE